FLASPEYFSKRAGGSNATFVDALYHDALGRSSAGDPGAAAMVAALDNGSATRDQAAFNVLLSDEGTRFTVVGEYVQFLDRQPGATDESHIQSLAQGLRNGIPEGIIVASIIGDQSQEFFNKVSA